MWFTCSAAGPWDLLDCEGQLLLQISWQGLELGSHTCQGSIPCSSVGTVIQFSHASALWCIHTMLVSMTQEYFRYVGEKGEQHMET